MRPIQKRANPKNYKEYGDAKTDLVENIGLYCSFCERHYPSDGITIEHIFCKDKYPHLHNSWRNFVFACRNCNGCKGTKEVILNEIHLPNLNNTFLSIEYLAGGLLKINPHLPIHEQRKAKNLIALVGLDKRPGHAHFSTKDNRWQDRMNVWDLAKRYLDKYEAKTADEEVIIDLVRTNGFWSIWMTVFQQHVEIRKRLIADFQVAKDCFDANTMPVFRRKNNTMV